MKKIIYLLSIVFVLNSHVNLAMAAYSYSPCLNYSYKLSDQSESNWLYFAKTDFFGVPIDKRSADDILNFLFNCAGGEDERGKDVRGEIDRHIGNSNTLTPEDKDRLLLAQSRLKQLRDFYLSTIVPQQKLEAEKVAMLAALEKENKQKDFKSGKVQLASIQDADTMVDGGALFTLAGSPLLNADGKMYKGRVRIDVQEGKLIRVLSEILGIQERRYPRYAYLKVVKTTRNFSPEGLRIGATIGVIGKYIGNMNYTTVGGETKTAPILEVAFLGN